MPGSERDLIVVHVLFAGSSVDGAPLTDDDRIMPRSASADERLWRRYRAEVARRTSFWRGRPRRGVTQDELDELAIHVGLFAAVVAMERRIDLEADRGDQSGVVTNGFHPSLDPHLPFDASHWLARNPWYEA